MRQPEGGEEYMEENTPVPVQKNNTNMVVTVVVIAVVLIGGFMFLNRPSTTEAPTMELVPTTAETDMVEPTTSTDASTGEPMAGDIVTIDMEAGSFYFTPKEIRVKKGQTVRVNLTAKDMMHNFNIDEFNIKGTTVKAGESTTIEFVADKVGSFEYYCSVANHRKNGQVGTLIVE